jgi:4-carboxymuconolactone decarboxylase
MCAAQSGTPEHHASIKQRFPELADALDTLGTTVRAAGPLDAKSGHLIQLAAAASIRSEGATHSHARRALQEGATPEEIRHTIVLLTSTIGFPTVAAALSWVDDVLEGNVV